MEKLDTYMQMYLLLDNQNVLSDETLANIMLTLSKLAVRNEFCQEIQDKGGLKFVLQCIEEKHLKNLSLIKSSLSLLKSICNNDQVKMNATKANAIQLLRSVLDKYQKNTYVRAIASKWIVFESYLNIGGYLGRSVSWFVRPCQLYCCGM